MSDAQAESAGAATATQETGLLDQILDSTRALDDRERQRNQTYIEEFVRSVMKGETVVPKNVEATILLTAAFVILLGRTFIGNMMTSWLPESLSFLQIPEMANWIMTVPNMAGQRAIMIGIALGIISTSLKLILGIERSYLGVDND